MKRLTLMKRLLSLALLLAGHAGAITYTYVQSKCSTYPSAPSVTLTSNVASGDILAAFGYSGNVGPITFTIADTLSNTWHANAAGPFNVNGPGDYSNNQGWYVLSSAAGADTITITPSSGGADLCVLEYAPSAGVSIDLQVGQTCAYPCGTQTQNYITNYNSELLIAMGGTCCLPGTTSLTGTSSLTQRANTTDNVMEVGDATVASASSQSFTQNASGGYTTVLDGFTFCGTGAGCTSGSAGVKQRRTIGEYKTRVGTRKLE